MIIDINRLFPHPLLRKDNENFSLGEFEASVSYGVTDSYYSFIIDVKLTENNLLDLYEKKQVILGCHLECSQTKYREFKELKLGRNEFFIGTDILEGRLQLLCIIVANENIQNYYSENFNEHYENNSFLIEKGSMLAIADIPSVIIENKKEEDATIPSIFDVRSDENDTIMSVGLTDNRIIINMPREEYVIRNANNNGYDSRRIMNSMIVFPVMVFVLNELSKPNAIDDYANLRWFKVINNKLKKLNYSLQDDDLIESDIFRISQLLLEDLFSDAMESINYLQEDEE